MRDPSAGASTNDISKAANHKVIYSPICYDNGGVVDDLLIYKFSDDHYLLVTNASNTDKDFDWIKEHLKGDVDVEAVNASHLWGQLAIQGPLAEPILQECTDFPLRDIRFFTFAPEVMVSGVKAIISRTGYTGKTALRSMYPQKRFPWSGNPSLKRVPQRVWCLSVWEQGILCVLRLHCLYTATSCLLNHPTGSRTGSLREAEQG